MTQKRPQQGDYALFYENYVSLVPSGDFLEILRDQRRELVGLLSPLSAEQAEFRYAPGKWSIKEVLGHITDAERIFAYRLLRIARGDETPLASFEQDGYIKAGNFSARKL
jgi:DinB superfamily